MIIPYSECSVCYLDQFGTGKRNERINVTYYPAKIPTRTLPHTQGFRLARFELIPFPFPFQIDAGDEVGLNDKKTMPASHVCSKL